MCSDDKQSHSLMLYSSDSWVLSNRWRCWPPELNDPPTALCKICLPTVGAHTCNPAGCNLQRLRQEDLRFRKNLYYTVKPFLMKSINKTLVHLPIFCQFPLLLKTFPIIRAYWEYHSSQSTGDWQAAKPCYHRELKTRKQDQIRMCCGGRALLSLTTSLYLLQDRVAELQWTSKRSSWK